MMDIKALTPEATAGWALALRAAVAILRREAEVGFTCPEYSVKEADCITARIHFRMAAARIERMLDEE